MPTTQPSGRTCPTTGGEAYAGGVRATHWRPVTRQHVLAACAAAGLEPKIVQPIEYNECDGHGVVAETIAAETIVAETTAC